MKFQGVFSDIDKHNHTLTIGTGSTATALHFGANPFVTSMDESDGTIYKPVKCQAGTIGLIAVADNYYMDLYTGDAHGNKVVLTDASDNVEWVGYITPSLYNIGYVRYLEDLSVDCLDGLSTLQYYKYEPIGATAATYTLLNVVLHCINKCGCYSKAIISEVLQRLASSTASVWEECYVSERNFLTKDVDDTDGKDTMTYLDVLEQICQWAGVTAIAKGDTVYLIDYDAVLPNKTRKYMTCNLSTGTITSHTTAPFTDATELYTITGNSYAADGTQLSLDNVYNKVTITDEANDLDELVVDFFHGAQNITVRDTGVETLLPFVGCTTGEFVDNTANGGEKMLAFFDYPDGGGQDSTHYNAVFLKYYASPIHTLYRYTSSWQRTTGYDNAVNFTDTKTINGAFLVRACVVQLDNTDFVKNWALGRVSQDFAGFTLDQVLAANEITDVSFTDYIFLTNHTPNGSRSNATAGNYPYFQTSANVDMGAFFGGKNSFLLIQGHYTWHDQDGDVYPVPADQVDIGEGRQNITQSDAYLLCRLQWGAYYWNGSQWATTSSTFKLWLEVEAERNDTCIYHERAIANTVTWRDGTSEKGYKIPMPTDQSLLTGAPVLTVYRPLDFSYYKCKFMALRDFGIKPVVGDPSFCDDQEADTSYTNVINNTYANELDEITYKVCTYDNKKPTLNAVAWYNGSTYYYLDTCYHVSMASDEVGIIRYNGSTGDGNMRAEEHNIFRLVNQYSEPAKVLSLTLHEDLYPFAVVQETNLSINCIIDKVDVDYRQQKFTYKLIEKK